MDELSNKAAQWLVKFIPWFLSLSWQYQEVVYFMLKYEINPNDLCKFVHFCKKYRF